MIFIKILKKIRHNKFMKQIAKNTDLSSESIYLDGFFVELRNPDKEKKYLSVGENCVIDGRFIFETNTGRIDIGDRVHIGNSVFISKESITIEDDVTIAWDCIFYDHNSHSVNWAERKNDTLQEVEDFKKCGNFIKNKDWSVVKSRPIHICSKAWIGMGCKILKGVTIGEGAVVAAGSVVVKDVEPWTVVGGNPATLIKELDVAGAKNNG